MMVAHAKTTAFATGAALARSTPTTRRARYDARVDDARARRWMRGWDLKRWWIESYPDPMDDSEGCKRGGRRGGRRYDGWIRSGSVGSGREGRGCRMGNGAWGGGGDRGGRRWVAHRGETTDDARVGDDAGRR